jgi:septin family protein
MQDLKDVTRDVHYENFRARYITEKLRRDQRERKSVFVLNFLVIVFCVLVFYDVCGDV